MALGNQRTAPVVVAHKSVSVRLMLYSLLALWVLLATSSARSQLVPGSMDVHWSEGAADCAKNSQPSLQVHPYNARTFILRENLCATFEAPFMYLLIGSRKALLIDTGDVADPNQVPLAKTVMQLVPGGRACQVSLACGPYPSAP
jgi:hydroxyacylglutathione hydrolase